ncbi:MAG: hypothetical protein ABI114_01150 [Rhodanobacter sp.]
MTESSTQLDPTRGPSSEPSSELSTRERIDALLDEALGETFPASDSSAIGSGIAMIKREGRERKIIDHANAVSRPMDATKPALASQIGPDGTAIL